MAVILDERALDDRLARLEAARNWSPRVVSRLESLIREGDDAALFRINPFSLAQVRGLDPAEAVDLMLHASALGLFEMDWLLVCPRCACAVESFAKLRAVMRHFRCPQCRNDYEAAMDDYIAVYFNISRQIADNRYHHPDELEPFDHMFAFKGVREGHVPNGGPYLDQVHRSFRAASWLEPGGTVQLAIDATPGTLSGLSSGAVAGFTIKIGQETATSPQLIHLEHDGDGYSPELARLSAGPVVIEITNSAAQRGIVSVLQFDESAAEMPEMLDFEPYLTGKHLLTSQTFKSLFRSEVVGGAQGLAIRDIALLFTDIKGSTALYQRIGDLNAFQLVQQHFDWLRDATVRQSGAVVKTIGDAVMAAYPDARSAVAAALDMRRAVERFNHERPDRAVSLKIGIHHGAAIAVTLNDELDYFGQTVNIASRVQALAGAAEICLTDEVWAYPGVQELLKPYAFRHDITPIQGLGLPLGVLTIGEAAV